ncbi:YlbF family regulator [Vagococcus lutrae]|uniref:YlbF family regulator n=1 Tax=Vagococcus lutrae TaxID=81947 RepID=UPI00288C9F6F|nr:YlbF family regulator [Vagococcus lutrae]MDT2801607.1 YlbF family regulator [Vagococcus lutrae]MDT2808417.1 YlbF family regulator [Vagococcus lutrae]
MTEERHIQDDDIQGALTTLLHQLQAYDAIQNYQLIEAQAKDHPALQELIERIKAEQKNVVQFEHYDKPVAAQKALKEADRLQAELENHPLVVSYRHRLIEANELVQYITQRIETTVNEELENKFLETFQQEEPFDEE